MSALAPPPRGRLPRWPLAALAASLLLVLQAALVFGPGGRDDVAITEFAAETLAREGRILNYNGEPLEQSSSLLHVLLLALAHATTGAAMPLVGILVAGAGGVATLVLLSRAAAGLAGRAGAWAPLILASMGPVAYWSWIGLETSWAMFLALAFPLAVADALEPGRGLLRGALGTAAMLGFLMVRPENPLVAVAFLAALAALSRTPLLRGEREVAGDLAPPARLLALGGGVVTASLALATWRLATFGDVFPQPVAAKAALPGEGRLLLGIGGIAVTLCYHPSLLLLAAAAGRGATREGRAPLEEVLGLRQRRRLLAAVAFVLAHLAFVVTSGGDWMEGGRFLVPLLPHGILLCLPGLGALAAPHRVAGTLVLLGCVEGALFARGWELRVPWVRGHPAAIRSAGGSAGVAWPGEHPAAAALRDQLPEVGERFHWVEFRNRLRLRDMEAAVALQRVVERLLERSDTVVLASAQAGKVVASVIRWNPGKIHFMDIHALSTRHFLDCPATRGVGNSLFGHNTGAAILLEQPERLRDECGLRRPDVVLALERKMLRRWTDLGSYRVVYRTVLNEAERWPGWKTGDWNLEEFVAVRPDRYRELRGLRLPPGGRTLELVTATESAAAETPEEVTPDPALRARVISRRALRYDAPADPALDRPPFVRAASAIRRWGEERLVILQDDLSHVGVLEGGRLSSLALPPGPDGRRRFEEALGNKHLKLDLEAAAALPGRPPRVLALGSGSLPAREVVVVLEEGAAPRVVPAGELFARLDREPAFSGSERNLEGAVVVGGALRLFQRGNGQPRAGREALDATADLDLRALERWLAGEGPAPAPTRVRRYRLGEVGGVAYGFTDAAARPDGAVLYVAVAEDSPDAVRDGAVLGCRVGVLSGGGPRDAPLLDERGAPFALKVEGIELAPGDPTRLRAVVDVDDPDEPALLLEVALEGPW